MNEDKVEVKFTKARDTVNYGEVQVGQKLRVSARDAKAFIANGVAEFTNKTDKKNKEA